MPLTCSHPAAVLPFRNFKNLSFAALVIGSVAPDVGYFIGQRYMAKLAHYPSGTLLINIPIGLILLAVFYLLRRDLTFLLPSPHRKHLMRLCDQKPTWNTRFILVAIISILIGSWTHIVWDQFTHDGNFLNRHVALLRIVLFHIRSYEVSVSHLLQYISTIGGGEVLIWFYWKWLRSQPRKPVRESDAWRYILLFCFAVVGLAAGIIVAIRLSDPIHDSETLREFVYKLGVTAVSVFTFLFTVGAVLCYRRHLSTADL